MQSNYEPLGKHISFVEDRNSSLITDKVLGISINKIFMPSVANTVGTDLSKYKVVTKGVFACNPMHVGRDGKIPVALYIEDKPAIVSPAYFVFKVKNENRLLPIFLMLCFKRFDFDRLCWFVSDASVRGGITWDEFCKIEIPVPPIEKQRLIVRQYQTISDKIIFNQRINDNLAA